MRGRLLCHLVDLLAGERLGQHARGHVGAQRHAEDLIPAVRGGDGLRTVDMPTASAPSTRAARTSAGVSNCGPGKYM